MTKTAEGLLTNFLNSSASFFCHFLQYCFGTAPLISRSTEIGLSTSNHQQGQQGFNPICHEYCWYSVLSVCCIFLLLGVLYREGNREGKIKKCKNANIEYIYIFRKLGNRRNRVYGAAFENNIYKQKYSFY